MKLQDHHYWQGGILLALVIIFILSTGTFPLGKAVNPFTSTNFSVSGDGWVSVVPSSSSSISNFLVKANDESGKEYYFDRVSSTVLAAREETFFVISYPTFHPKKSFTIVKSSVITPSDPIPVWFDQSNKISIEDYVSNDCRKFNGNCISKSNPEFTSIVFKSKPGTKLDSCSQSNWGAGKPNPSIEQVSVIDTSTGKAVDSLIGVENVKILIKLSPSALFDSSGKFSPQEASVTLVIGSNEFKARVHHSLFRIPGCHTDPNQLYVETDAFKASLLNEKNIYAFPADEYFDTGKVKGPLKLCNSIGGTSCPGQNPISLTEISLSSMSNGYNQRHTINLDSKKGLMASDVLNAITPKNACYHIGLLTDFNAKTIYSTKTESVDFPMVSGAYYFACSVDGKLPLSIFGDEVDDNPYDLSFRSGDVTYVPVRPGLLGKTLISVANCDIITARDGLYLVDPRTEVITQLNSVYEINCAQSGKWDAPNSVPGKYIGRDISLTKFEEEKSSYKLGETINLRVRNSFVMDGLQVYVMVDDNEKIYLGSLSVSSYDFVPKATKSSYVVEFGLYQGFPNNPSAPIKPLHDINELNNKVKYIINVVE